MCPGVRLQIYLEKISLADDTDHAPAAINDREAGHPRGRHQLQSCFKVGVLMHAVCRTGHDLANKHVNHPFERKTLTAQACLAVSKTGTVTNVSRLVAVRQRLPEQRRPPRRPCPQAERTAMGLSPLAKVSQPAVHGGWRDPDAIVGNLDLNRAVDGDTNTGA